MSCKSEEPAKLQKIFETVHLSIKPINVFRAAADEMQSCPTSLVLKYLQVEI